MSDTKIDKREDVNASTGEKKYGDVKFADPTNNKYPIDTPNTFAPPGVILTTKIMRPNTIKMKLKSLKTE